MDTAEANVATTHASIDAAKANLAQAAAQLNQAQVNLSYTNIASPIDGVVISRSVDVGQTVAASLSAPVLFTIAQDLTKMQVDTSVSEGDVGRLAVGMRTYFTVDSYPGQRFNGDIRQIRNAATTLQNVVTYDAVIDVPNDDLRLRPGMTANVTVVYDERKDVLTVSNAALRFHAPPSLAGSSSAGHGGREFVVVGKDGTLTLPADLVDEFPPGSLAEATRAEGGGVLLRRVDPGGLGDDPGPDPGAAPGFAPGASLGDGEERS